MKLRLFLPALLCAATVLFAACSARSSAGPTLPEGITADFDLTSFSDTAAYAEVSRMQVYTEEYEGKTVMLRGTFRAFPDPDSDGYLFKCVVQDGTGCCTRDMEFVPDAAYSYPEDFPKKDKEIIVVGTLATYNRTGGQYCTLTNARFFT